MLRLPFIRFFAILVAVLFLLGQGVASAHTAEHGDHHDHDGVACTVSVLGEDAVVLPAPLEGHTAPVEENPVVALNPTRVHAFTSNHPNRAPPPRAPPH